MGDDKLASNAHQFALSCPSVDSKHRPKGIGENIAKGSVSFQLTNATDFTPSVQSWYDEIQDAGPYKTGGTFKGFDECSGVCRHYTQVVWAAADKIGCGVSYCLDSGG